jgi:hypothetical protein
MHEKLLERFNSQSSAWITDGYAAELRCIRQSRGSELFIHDGMLTLAPPWACDLLNPQNDMHLETANLFADQQSATDLTRDSLVSLVRTAATGCIKLNALTATLRIVERPIDYYSEVTMRDRWTFPLHLQVQGDKAPPLSPLEAAAIDDALRQASPPFDGFADLSHWLNLNGALDGTRPSNITVKVLPPIELLLTDSKFENEQLTLRLRCSASADFNQIRLAARIVPGTVSAGRLQVAEQVLWETDNARTRHCTGTVTICTGSAVSVQILLSYKGYSVARQWFHDSSKSTSARHLSMIQFDPELKGLRAALFINNDSRDFEKAVGCVAYLVGLASALPLQSRTPDLDAATPRGRQLVIECTLATSDFPTKMGKLVDRCNALKKSLAANGLGTAEVFGVLVCRQPSDQIARDDADLQRHRILLVTGEDLERALTGSWHSVDADLVIDKAVAAWAMQRPFD